MLTGVGYPRRLLDSGERIVLELHPHGRALVVPALLVPVVGGLGAFAASVVPGGSAQGPLRIAVGVVGLLVLVVGSLSPFLRWVTTLYVVTDRRIAVRTGILKRSGRDVPLPRVNDVTFEHTVVERLFRSGTLIIESAGERGQVQLDDVPRVEQVQSTVYRLVEDDDERRRGGQPVGWA